MSEHTKGKLKVNLEIKKGWTVELKIMYMDILHGCTQTQAIANADRLVKCWNEHDELLDNLLNLTRLLCHPGSHVTAVDIKKAKNAIAKAGVNTLWGI